MSALYGLGRDDVPEFVGMADEFMAFEDLPESTRVRIQMLLDFLRGLHLPGPVGLEAAVQFVAAAIDESDESSTDPRDGS